MRAFPAHESNLIMQRAKVKHLKFAGGVSDLVLDKQADNTVYGSIPIIPTTRIAQPHQAFLRARQLERNVNYVRGYFTIFDTLEGILERIHHRPLGGFVTILSTVGGQINQLGAGIAVRVNFLGEVVGQCYRTPEE